MKSRSRIKTVERPRFQTLREYVNAQPRTKTQSDIAAELDIAPNTLSQYLGGHRTPSREIALRLASQCDISLEGLLDPEAKAS